MKKCYVLMLLLCLIGCINLQSSAMACTEDCDKECDYETSHAEIRQACEQEIAFTKQIVQAAGGKYENIYTLDQCIQDATASYRQDCMNGCDKCRHDKNFLGGCFVDPIPNK